MPSQFPRVPPMSHPFDTAIALKPLGPDHSAGHTQPGYANVVGPFGGTTAAVLLNAALQHPARLGDPIALTVNYAAPVADGGFELHARPARTNRSTQHWQLELVQDGAVVVTGSAVFAQRRSTWGAPEARPPEGLPPAEVLAPAALPGFPAWTQRYEFRFPPGEAPQWLDGTEQPHARSHLWIRDQPPRPLDFAALAALADAFFPRIFVRRRRPVPAGTVTLTTYFHADAAQLAAQGERPVLGVARPQVFRNGYFDQSAELWDAAGHLLASSHQMVYYRE